MLKQSLQQKLLQKLSPQQIQLMKLLQVPTIALEQRIKEEMEVNPALEEGRDDDDEDEEQGETDDEQKVEEVEEYEEEKKEKEEKEEDYSDDYREERQEKEEPNDDFNIDDYLQDYDSSPDYKYNANNTSKDDEEYEVPVTVSTTFQEQLILQLGLTPMNEKEHRIAEHLVGSLDDDGYLRRDLSAISNDLAFTQNIETDVAELEDVLKTIQTLDPPGVGARNLQECLLLQLHRTDDGTKEYGKAIEIVQKYMDEFSKKHYAKIAARCDLDDEELKEVMHIIIKLNPRPGNTAYEGQRSAQHIVPDFIVGINEGVLELSLNSKNMPELRLSKTYMEMLQTYAKDKSKNRASREALTFVKQKIDSAKWFIDAIKQRNDTLLTTMTTIMNYQYDFFLEGDEKLLKPMILKDIADIVGLDISTVSRVANSKYVQTQFGTFLLKRLFSEAMQTDSGEEVSSREVKKILEEAIAGENKRKPLPDDKLMKLLNDKGYNIARRTIAKYREQLGIPVARLRKEL
ncbi:MAG: RNA polymerase factor sigma-54 [Bacteroidia bacterium]